MHGSAYSFAQDVDCQIEALSRDEYLQKKGRAKRLREELYPIARLGLHLKLPGVKVEVEAYENSGAADGHICQSGTFDVAFDVQVTYVDNHEEALRRELLASQGVAPGAGEIYHDKKTRQIIAEVGSEDIDQPTIDLAASILELFRKKAKLAYEKNTVLIIAFDEIMLQGCTAWKSLLAKIVKGGGLVTSPFRSVYLINCSTNELQRVA